LSKTGLTTASGETLKYFLQTNTTLQKLVLDDTLLRNVGFTLIADGLSSNPKSQLTTLSMIQSGVSPNITPTLLKLLQVNGSLKFSFGFKFSTEDAASIRQVLQRNKTQKSKSAGGDEKDDSPAAVVRSVAGTSVATVASSLSQTLNPTSAASSHNPVQSLKVQDTNSKGKEAKPLPCCVL
jgi:hypothetical protein